MQPVLCQQGRHRRAGRTPTDNEDIIRVSNAWSRRGHGTPLSVLKYWPNPPLLHTIISALWLPDKQGNLRSTTSETMYQHDGRWCGNRLYDKAHISTHGLAQVVQARSDACAHRHRGRGYAKSPKTAVFTGEMGHRGQPGIVSP